VLTYHTGDKKIGPLWPWFWDSHISIIIKTIKDSLQQFLNAQKLCTRVGTITNRWKAICIIWFIFWDPREKRTSLRSKPALRFFPWRWGGSSTQAWMPTYVSILRIPQIIWVCRATVEWYIDRRKPKNSEKNLSQCYSVHHKSHINDRGANPGLRCERPETNHLSHGTAPAPTPDYHTAWRLTAGRSRNVNILSISLPRGSSQT
jgi:hypothetical protein